MRSCGSIIIITVIIIISRIMLTVLASSVKVHPVYVMNAVRSSSMYFG